jgi:hypothetical protein
MKLGRRPGGVPEHLLSEYIDEKDPTTVVSADKVLWKCPEGHEYLAALRHRKIGTGCVYCAGRAVLVGFNDIGTTHHELAKQWDDERDINGFTASSNKKVQWKCDQGHQWIAEVNSRKKGNGCPACSGQLGKWKAPDGYDKTGYTSFASEFPEYAKMLSSKNPFTASSVPPSSTQLAIFECPLGHEWQQQVYVVARGHGCPTCAGKGVEEGFNDLATTHPHLIDIWSSKNHIRIEEVSHGSTKKVLWECPNGHEWPANIGQVSRGTGCPRCSNHISKPEIQIREMLGDVEAVFNDRSLIGPKELDIYLPDDNLAIEFNGVYWHTEDRVGKKYHYDKWRLCKDKGVQLLQIWEDDWAFNREVVENTIKSKLLGRKPIGARKVKVVEIDFYTAADLLSKWHIQGKANGTYYLGLEYDGEVVCVGVWKRQGNGTTMRLERFAGSRAVYGGLNKMISYLPYNEFVTFADHTISDGRLYEATGWVNDGEINPDYYYLVGGEREHKFNYRIERFKRDPDLLYEEGMTERQLAELNGLERIYDAGKTRYKYTK